MTTKELKQIEKRLKKSNSEKLYKQIREELSLEDRKKLCKMKAMQMVHDHIYVRFDSKHCDSTKVFKKELLSQVETLVEQGYREIEPTTVRESFPVGTYSISRQSKDDDMIRLTWNDGEYHQRRCNYKDDAKNKITSGESPIKTVKKEFKARTSMTLTEAFGSVPQYYKRCVPGLFHWDNPEYITGDINKIFGCYKYDYTSHFPACAEGTLPDANTAVTYDGYVPPTEEYPFAFYPANGYVAEYGKYCTADWHNSIYGEALFESKKRKWKVKRSVEDREMYTVLMKPSKYSIFDEMIEFYDVKASCPKGSDEREEAKVILLKIIGQFEQNKLKAYTSSPYAHLASIIKARAIWKMINLINTLGEENTISVIVDGIICKNPARIKVEDDTEFLGSLKLESANALGKFRGHNQYVLKDKTGVNIAHAGYDLNIGEDISKWGKSPSMNLIKTIQGLGVIIYSRLDKGIWIDTEAEDDYYEEFSDEYDDDEGEEI